jgi:hypothetical protein
MELSPSWEANSRSATQELPNILRNPKAHYLVHMSPSLVPVLRQMSPVQITPYNFPKNHFNFIFPPTSRSS